MIDIHVHGQPPSLSTTQTTALPPRVGIPTTQILSHARLQQSRARSKRLPVAPLEWRRRDTALGQFRFAATTAYFVRGSVGGFRA
jgi:hypothetical protein